MKRKTKTRRRHKQRKPKSRRKKGGDIFKGLFSKPETITTPPIMPMQKKPRGVIGKDRVRGMLQMREELFPKIIGGYFAMAVYVTDRLDKLITPTLRKASAQIGDPSYNTRWSDFFKWRYPKIQIANETVPEFETILIENQSLFVECLAQAINVVKLRYYCTNNEQCRPRLIPYYAADERIIETLQQIEDFVCLFIDLCSFDVRTPSAVFNNYGIPTGENNTSYSTRSYCQEKHGGDMPTISPFQVVTEIATNALSIYSQDVSLYEYNPTLMEAAINEKRSRDSINKDEEEARMKKLDEEHKALFS
jgi:hypothetical protein